MKKETNKLTIELNPNKELVFSFDIKSMTYFSALITSLLKGELDETIILCLEEELKKNGMDKELKEVAVIKENTQNIDLNKMLNEILINDIINIMNPSKFK